ncbi:hypothetical protein KC19_3G062200 [Ceratodon purpureus]|uniref:Uncharacterized protein n=1 Tax=Ceratodon purpureus TaxID=3225 RepID=A0A8T0II28_CERPU|nr:hypothetical protein KC19_3G062200 [Ceratodon purpureus]
MNIHGIVRLKMPLESLFLLLKLSFTIHDVFVEPCTV